MGPLNRKPILQRKIAIGTSIVNAQYSLELSEKNIIYLALAGISQKEVIENGSWHEVNLNDFAMLRSKEKDGRIVPLRKDQAREELTKYLKTLYNRSIRIKNDKGVYENHRWLSATRELDENDTIALKWNYELIPHLSDLKSYANIATKTLIGVKGKYTHRILELVSQGKIHGRTHGVVKVDLKEFLSSIEAPETYREFKYLNQFVLKPSIEELESKGINIKCVVQRKGVGKKVTGFELHWW